MDRPYAATANVIGVLERVRSRNLPDVIDNDLLRVAGVPEVAFGRVSQALRFLDLVDADGRPSERLRRIAAATDADYRAALGEALNEVYADDFARVDPAKDSQATIIDAFQPYEPRSQTARMVMLFLGLCRAAGMEVLEAPRERKMQAGHKKPAKRSPAKRVRSDEKRRSQGVDSSASGTVFSVTEEDLAALDDEAFEDIWAALGRLARARARARHSAQDALNPAGEAADGDSDEAPGPPVSSDTPGASEGVV